MGKKNQKVKEKEDTDNLDEEVDLTALKGAGYHIEEDNTSMENHYDESSTNKQDVMVGAKKDLFDFSLEDVVSIDLSEANPVVVSVPSNEEVDSVAITKVTDDISLSEIKSGEDELISKLNYENTDIQIKKKSKIVAKPRRSKEKKKIIKRKVKPKISTTIIKNSSPKDYNQSFNNPKFKKMILYLDELLSELPKDVIENFVYSQHYDEYIKLLKKLEK